MLETEKMLPMHADDVYEIEKASIPNPWSRETLLAEITKENGVCFICRCDGKIASYICASDISGELEIDSVATHPDFRRKKIASALMEKFIAEARGRGFTAIHLEVRKSNEAAINLYKKFGFAAVGERKKYYSDNGEDAILMTVRW